LAGGKGKEKLLKSRTMTEILIRAGKQKTTVPLSELAIPKQLKLLKTSIKRTEIKIKSFEQKYNMSTEQFMQKIREGMDDDNLDYVEWIGERKILKRLEEEFNKIKCLNQE